MVDTYVTPAMIDATNKYIDHCRSIMAKCDIHHIELKVQVERYVKEGFGTADFVGIEGVRKAPQITKLGRCKTLYISDLKYGQGVKVEADKPQIAYYALGVIETLGFKPDKIVCHIVQPRLHHLSKQEYTYEEILSFASTLKLAAHRVEDMDSLFREERYEEMVFNPSESACRFCLARWDCRARDEYITDPLKSLGLSTITTNGRVSNPLAKETILAMSDDELGERYLMADMCIRYGKELKDRCTSIAATGKKIAKLKLVEGRSNRAWKDEAELKKWCAARNILPYKTPEVMTPAQLEKEFKNRDEEFPEQFVHKPRGKPVLVTEDDKREEMIEDDLKSLLEEGLL